MKKRMHGVRYSERVFPSGAAESCDSFREKRRAERKNDFLQGFLILCGIGTATGILYWTGIGCFWRYWFGMECPTCGMTRAWISLFHGDLSGAFRNHRMFWSVPLLFLFVLANGRIFRKKWVNVLLLSLIGTGFAVCYILRLLGI